MHFMLGVLASTALLGSWPHAHSHESIIYRFQAGFDAFGPRAGLISDRAGDLYGTTFDGGGPAGAGTVYRLAPPSVSGGAWTETILHRFSYHSISEGLSPWGGLAMDASGNLYGTAWLGGTCGSCGLVFELSPRSRRNGTWKYQIIHDFLDDGVDGINPRADLTIDSAGDLFGTTASGGTGGCVGGCGTVFELVPSNGQWAETIVHSFPAHGSGFEASGGTGGGVVLDGAGHVYGTTYEDGGGLGSVFELVHVRAGWKYRDIYAFADFADGVDPTAGVTFDAAGSLYGTTSSGGTQGCYGSGCGTVFRLTPQPDGTWAHTVLYAFRGIGDGGTPAAGVIAGTTGSIYGTTQLWGTGAGCSGSGCGVAFRLTSTGAGGSFRQAVLHTFRNGGDGYVPYGELIFGVDGRIYGATQFGGKATCSSGFGCGTAFALTP